MRKYDPAIHHRRSVRLRGYDYSQAGAYFVTICAQGRRCLFGEIINHEMHLNEFGIIAYQEWEALPARWKHIDIGAFQIMPNHMHGVIIINTILPSEAAQTASHNLLPMPISPNLIDTKTQWADNPTLGQIVGAYCSITQVNCVNFVKGNKPNEYLGKVWQRNYHEHIIRSVKAFDMISNYIINNPANWEKDTFFTPINPRSS